MAGIIDFLLGHKAYEWKHGTLSFQTSLEPLHIVAGVAVLVLAVFFLYRTTTARTSPRLKTVLIVLKSVTLAVLFVCLLQPTLTTSSPGPRKSTTGFLIDNSHSMTIRDVTGSRSRGEVAADLLYGSNGLIDRLRDRFTIRTFGFDRNIRPVSGSGDLSFSGSMTDITGAMSAVGETLGGLGLSSLVLVTDGADNGNDDPLRMAGILKTRQIPVYIIGVGNTRPPADVAIHRVQTTGPVIEGGVFEVQVTVISRGYEGRQFDLLIEEGSVVVASKRITHGPDGRPERHTLQMTLQKEGSLVYTARIPEQQDEFITENNRMAFLVDNRTKGAQILYIEGHPRNEYKFIRRAAAGDEAVRLKTYLQTGPQKFLRQDIESPQELSRGYPSSREELFAYDAVIFGDIPRNFFSDDQLRLTREFVSRRGGGFLMIGGLTSFDEGFIQTPIEDLLPVTLVREKNLAPGLRGGGRKGTHPTGQKFSLRLTAEGRRSALLRLATDKHTNRQIWTEMPQLQGINVTGRAKPGATVLAVHPTLQMDGNPLPVFVYQRYGRGRSMAITTAATWRWQMLMPHEDRSHQKIWRQILRWLTVDTPARVKFELARRHYSTGETVKVRARIHDERFKSVGNATVWLKTTDPEGAVRDLRMEGSLAQTGDYIGTFTAPLPGLYQLEVSSTDNSHHKESASAHVLVTDTLHEFRDLSLNTELLENIARASGGKYYNLQDAGRVVKDLQRIRETQTLRLKLDIWDMPAVLLFLLACYAAEWILRRRKGLS